MTHISYSTANSNLTNLHISTARFVKIELNNIGLMWSFCLLPTILPGEIQTSRRPAIKLQEPQVIPDKDPGIHMSPYASRKPIFSVLNIHLKKKTVQEHTQFRRSLDVRSTSNRISTSKKVSLDVCRTYNQRRSAVQLPWPGCRRVAAVANCSWLTSQLKQKVGQKSIVSVSLEVSTLQILQLSTRLRLCAVGFAKSKYDHFIITM